MISRKKLKNSVILLLMAGTICVSAQTVNLPTIKIQGKEYYYYKVKKGDSPYGICKKYNWDEARLRSTNANFATKITKGQTVYYPVNSEGTNVVSLHKKVKEVVPGNIVHTVKRGDNVCSIAKLYDVPVDLIYSLNPSSRHGVKIGDKITISQPANKNGDKDIPFYYTVRENDTLLGLSDKYNCGVDNIMEANPGISERNLKAGDVIKIYPNARQTTVTKQVVEMEQVTGFTPYKVKKNDSWEKISTQTGVDSTTLVSANRSAVLPKKGQWITIPKIENVKTETMVEVSVNDESTIENRDKIYRKLHNIDKNAAVNVAVVLDSPSSKSNADFMRGFLVGVDSLKNAGFKTRVSVIDASKGIQTIGADSILTASNLIVGVYDSDFPEYLANIGKSNDIEVVNVLDTKSDLYETNHSMIQILQPIDYFNDMAASHLRQHYPDYQLLMVGDIDESDKFADSLTAGFPPDMVTHLSLEEFSVYPFDVIDKYLVYSYALKKDAISEFMDAVIALQSEGKTLVPVGRAQWVAYAAQLDDKYGTAGVLVPSRFYSNPASAAQSDFNASFHKAYHRNPVNSFPQYAMLGYDVASYFLPVTAANGGDYNTGLSYRPGLQNDIDIKRLNSWSGFINTNGYVLKYFPENVVEKIEIQ